MMLNTITLLLIGGSLTCVLGCFPYFSCLRTGENGCNGGNCLNDGCCSCSGNKFWYDCGKDTTVDVNSSSCASPCENGGLCVEPVGGSSECICDEEYYGPSCNFERLQAKCSIENKMIVNVNLVHAGGMVAHVKGLKDACPINDIPNNLGDIPPEWNGKAREITLPTDTNCGNAIAGDDGSICHTVIIQYLTTPDVITELDFQVKFCCRGGVVTKTIGTVDPDSVSLPTEDIFKQDTSEFIVGTMTDPSGNVYPDGSSLLVGDPLWLKVEIVAGDYAGLYLENVIAHTGSLFGPTIDLYDNGCEHDLLRGEVVHASDKMSVVVKTKVLKFIDSATLAFVVQVRTCIQLPGCIPMTCTRRKREAGPGPSNSTLSQQFTSKINVMKPDAAAFCEARAGSVSLGAIITLATLAFILLTLFSIMSACVVITKRRLNSKP